MLKRFSIIAALAILLLIAIALNAPSFEQCVRANENASTHNKLKENLPVFVIAFSRGVYCFGPFFAENRDAFAAFSTVLLAIFTGTLWWSTEKLWRASSRQLDLATAEFVSAHRPKLRIRNVILHSPLVAGEPLKIQCRIVNIGDTKTRIARNEFRVKVIPPVESGAPRKREPVIDAKEIGVGRIVPAGGHLVLLATMDQAPYDPAWQLTFGDQTFLVGGHARLSLWIVVAHTDDNGVTRETAAYREWNYPDRGFTLPAEPDPDYEYED
jgi:hypothetical protein